MASVRVDSRVEFFSVTKSMYLLTFLIFDQSFCVFTKRLSNSLVILLRWSASITSLFPEKLDPPKNEISLLISKFPLIPSTSTYSYRLFTELNWSRYRESFSIATLHLIKT